MAVCLLKPTSSGSLRPEDIEMLYTRIAQLEQTVANQDKKLAEINCANVNVALFDIPNRVMEIEKSILNLTPKINAVADTGTDICNALLILKQQVDMITTVLKVRGLM